VAAGVTKVTQSDHGSDQKASQKWHLQIWRNSTPLVKMAKWVKWHIWDPHPCAIPTLPLPLLTREHRGFLYGTLDHAREAGQPLAPFWGLNGAASCCILLHACMLLLVAWQGLAILICMVRIWMYPPVIGAAGVVKRGCHY